MKPLFVHQAERAARLAHPIFVENGWTYTFAKSPDGIPTYDELADAILNLLLTVQHKQIGPASTAHFIVNRVTDNEESEPRYTIDLQLDNGF